MKEKLCADYLKAVKNGSEEKFLNTLDVMQLVILRYNLGLVRIGENFQKEYSDEDLNNSNIINSELKARIGK